MIPGALTLSEWWAKPPECSGGHVEHSWKSKPPSKLRLPHFRRRLYRTCVSCGHWQMTEGIITLRIFDPSSAACSANDASLPDKHECSGQNSSTGVRKAAKHSGRVNIIILRKYMTKYTYPWGTTMVEDMATSQNKFEDRACPFAPLSIPRHA